MVCIAGYFDFVVCFMDCVAGYMDCIAGYMQIVDASTYKSDLVILVIQSSSFAKPSCINRYSIRTTSSVGFHTVEG